jgi:hypothetical protein
VVTWFIGSLRDSHLDTGNFAKFGQRNAEYNQTTPDFVRIGRAAAESCADLMHLERSYKLQLKART